MSNKEISKALLKRIREQSERGLPYGGYHELRRRPAPVKNTVLEVPRENGFSYRFEESPFRGLMGVYEAEANTNGNGIYTPLFTFRALHSERQGGNRTNTYFEFFEALQYGDKEVSALVGDLMQWSGGVIEPENGIINLVREDSNGMERALQDGFSWLAGNEQYTSIGGDMDQRKTIVVPTSAGDNKVVIDGILDLAYANRKINEILNQGVHSADKLRLNIIIIDEYEQT